MKNLKKICTWIIWCIISPIWEAAFKYCKYITVPEIEKVHEHFRNLIYGLGNLGETAKNFDSSLNKRLRLLLYWAGKHEGITLDINSTKTSVDLMKEINSLNKEKPFGITIKQEEEYFSQFKYKTPNSSWIVQRFPDGTIWGKELSNENERIAYLVNIMLNWKEV